MPIETAAIASAATSAHASKKGRGTDTTAELACARDTKGHASPEIAVQRRRLCSPDRRRFAPMPTRRFIALIVRMDTREAFCATPCAAGARELPDAAGIKFDADLPKFGLTLARAASPWPSAALLDSLDRRFASAMLPRLFSLSIRFAAGASAPLVPGGRAARRPVGYRTSFASGMLDGPNLRLVSRFGSILESARVLGENATKNATGDAARDATRDATEGRKRLRAELETARDPVSTSDMLVVVLSGSGVPGDRERHRQLGFDDHPSKPFRRRAAPAMLSNQVRSPDPIEPKDTLASVRADAEPAPPAGEPVLDAAALARLGELDPKGENRLLERILKAFQTSVARLQPQLEVARQGGDLPTIRLVAHTLKSSSASIGALRLSQLCAQVETSIRLESTQDLSASLATFDLALDSAMQAIESLLKERA